MPNENADRITRAALALTPYFDEDDLESPVVDLLTDLRHYCDANSLDFEHLANISHGHWCEEDGELPGTFANEPEQDRIHELMSQVAREAIASVNESAFAISTAGGASGHTEMTLYAFSNGQWQILTRVCQGSPIARAPIQHYEATEELADALRASL